MTKRHPKFDPVAVPADRPLDPLLCFNIYSTGLAFNRVYKRVLDGLGLTYPQYLVMVALWHLDEQTVSELGEQLFLESNTLTPLLKRLEASGLVARRRGDADERVVRISLTDRGRALAIDATCVSDEILRASGMPAEDFERLNRMLETLRSNLLSAD